MTTSQHCVQLFQSRKYEEVCASLQSLEETDLRKCVQAMQGPILALLAQQPDCEIVIEIAYHLLCSDMLFTQDIKLLTQILSKYIEIGEGKYTFIIYRGKIYEHQQAEEKQFKFMLALSHFAMYFITNVSNQNICNDYVQAIAELAQLLDKLSMQTTDNGFNAQVIPQQQPCASETGKPQDLYMQQHVNHILSQVQKYSQQLAEPQKWYQNAQCTQILQTILSAHLLPRLQNHPIILYLVSVVPLQQLSPQLTKIPSSILLHIFNNQILPLYSPTNIRYIYICYHLLLFLLPKSTNNPLVGQDSFMEQALHKLIKLFCRFIDQCITISNNCIQVTGCTDKQQIICMDLSVIFHRLLMLLGFLHPKNDVQVYSCIEKTVIKSSNINIINKMQFWDYCLKTSHHSYDRNRNFSLPFHVFVLSHSRKDFMKLKGTPHHSKQMRRQLKVCMGTVTDNLMKEFTLVDKQRDCDYIGHIISLVVNVVTISSVCHKINGKADVLTLRAIRKNCESLAEMLTVMQQTQTKQKEITQIELCKLRLGDAIVMLNSSIQQYSG